MKIIEDASFIRFGWLSLVVIAVVLVFFWRCGLDAGYVTVVVIGGSVGAVELLGRYLYAPVRAILTGSGASYILVNMAAAAAAFYMIGPHGFDVFGQAEARSKLDLLELKAILLAGFGALAFMRSSLFKFRVGANDIGIGPAAVLDTLLLVADRGVDRQEAILRAAEVTNMLRGADPVKGSKILASYCLALMQNVTADETKSVLDAVKRIASEEEYDKDVRLDLIALELTKIVGPTVLEAAVIALGSRLSPLRMAKETAAPPASASMASATPSPMTFASVPSVEDIKAAITHADDAEALRGATGSPGATGGSPS